MDRAIGHKHSGTQGFYWLQSIKFEHNNTQHNLLYKIMCTSQVAVLTTTPLQNNAESAVKSVIVPFCPFPFGHLPIVVMASTSIQFLSVAAWVKAFAAQSHEHEEAAPNSKKRTSSRIARVKMVQICSNLSVSAALLHHRLPCLPLFYCSQCSAFRAAV